MKLSTHVRFLITTCLVAFVSFLFTQAPITAWLTAHPLYEALSGSFGAAWGAYVTYSKPTQS